MDDNLVELRFAGAPGSAGVRTFAFRDSTVNLGEPVIRDEEITAVETRLQNGGLMMMLHLSDDGEENLTSATTERQGESLALVVGGEARSVVTVQGPLGVGGVLGVGFATPDSTAARLDAAIRDRWPQAAQ